MGWTITGGWNFSGGMNIESPPPPAYSLWAVGFGAKIGNNSTVHRSSPVQVGTGITWSKIYGGSGAVIGLKTDNSLWTWGQNDSGQLGLNTAGNYASSPVQVGTDTTWSKIGGILFSTMAIKTDGTLWMWGSSGSGQLGQNDKNSRSSPTQVGAGTTWALVVEGQGFGNGESVLATKTDGTLWAWGNNAYGNLGLGDRVYRSSPAQVGAGTGWATTGSGKLAANSTGILAIKSDGTLWGWGANDYGQLGTNNLAMRSSPVQVGALTNWSNISAGWLTTVATKTDGTLWAWGYNIAGILGQNDAINRSSPVQIGSGTTWSTASAGMQGVAAVKTDGTLWTWGTNLYGQLGKNDVVYRSSPTQVGALTTWQTTPGSVAMGITMLAISSP